MEQGQHFYRELSAYYDELFPVDPDAVEFLRARAPAGRPVLDVACGTGAHVIALEGHGIDAYGVDNSPEMVEIAQKRQPDRFARMDMREINAHPKKPFGMTYSIGNSVAHLPLPGDVASFSASVYDSLMPSGVAIFQIIDVSDLDVGTVYPLSPLSGADATLERTYTVEGKGTGGVAEIRFEAELTIGGMREARRVEQRLLGISPDKIRRLLKDEHFQGIELFAGFSDVPFEESESRVAVITAFR